MTSETTTTTFQTVAQEFAAAFETARRDENDAESTYTRLRDEYRGTWAQDIVFEAHGDMFPDDWKYACISAAADRIAECVDEDEADDARGEFADNEVDVYNAARIEWLGSHSARQGYCDDAAAEFGSGDTSSDIVAMIGQGQYFEADEVYGLTLQALVDRAEELDAENES